MDLILESLSLTDLLGSIYEANAQKFDELSQYSMPFGRPTLREAIRQYYRRFYGIKTDEINPGLQDWVENLDPNKHITVTLGATEAMACVLRVICEPGDSILVVRFKRKFFRVV